MTLPFAGHPVGALHPLISLGPDDRIESAYRFLIADAMPFGKNARIQLEHGGENQSTEHYQSVVYWYGKPGACLVQTDILDVGDNADEQAHSYLSPTASAPQTISSRYELSVDHNAAGESSRAPRHRSLHDRRERVHADHSARQPRPVVASQAGLQLARSARHGLRRRRRPDAAWSRPALGTSPARTAVCTRTRPASSTIRCPWCKPRIAAFVKTSF